MNVFVAQISFTHTFITYTPFCNMKAVLTLIVAARAVFQRHPGAAVSQGGRRGVLACSCSGLRPCVARGRAGTPRRPYRPPDCTYI